MNLINKEKIKCPKCEIDHPKDFAEINVVTFEKYIKDKQE